MKESIRRRLERSFERFEELSALLADPDVIGEPGRFRDLSVEYARLEPVAERFRALRSLETERDYARELLRGADASLRELAEAELEELDGRIESEGLELTRLLVPRDPRDDSNIFLEIRAGTGGDEAAIFAGDLFRTYARYAERQGWRVEVLSESPGEHGGYREIISRVVGSGGIDERTRRNRPLAKDDPTLVGPSVEEFRKLEPRCIGALERIHEPDPAELVFPVLIGGRGQDVTPLNSRQILSDAEPMIRRHLNHTPNHRPSEN